jgi:hypothetical protein
LKQYVDTTTDGRDTKTLLLSTGMDSISILDEMSVPELDQLLRICKNSVTIVKSQPKLAVKPRLFTPGLNKTTTEPTKRNVIKKVIQKTEVVEET